MSGGVDKFGEAEKGGRKKQDCIYGEGRKREGKKTSVCGNIVNCASRVHDIGFNCSMIA